MVTSSSPGEASSDRTVEVGVIGSARIDAGDRRYADAERLGRALAAEGWTVVTGGYGGLMGATSGGAAAAGGHTVGLPMSDWKHLTPHESNAELRWSVDYAERLRHLLAADVVVALPGGIGTLSEAAMVTLASVIEKETGQADERPLISGVFHNRLRLGMPLQSDPTVLDGRANGRAPLTRADLANAQPYNTYVHRGLPQTLAAAVGRDMTSHWIGGISLVPTDGHCRLPPRVGTPGYYRAFLWSPVLPHHFRFALKQNRECAD